MKFFLVVMSLFLLCSCDSKFQRARKSANSSSAIASLRSISISQVLFQQSLTVDQNTNGAGEYGFLQELAGTIVPRGRDQEVNPSFISAVLGDSAKQNGGIAEKSGYCFLVYLPDGEKQFIRETTDIKALKPNTPAKETAIIRQEQNFIVYAWPVSSTTGTKAFCINQAGVVIATGNTKNGSLVYEGKDNIPAFDAAYSKDDLLVEEEEKRKDGQIWGAN